MRSGDVIYAWQELNESEDAWLIIGVLAEGGQPTPLVHRDRATVDAWRPIAQLHRTETGNPVRLAGFTLGKVFEQMANR